MVAYKDDKCESCRFWELINDKGGTCKRYPPNTTAIAVQQMGQIVRNNRPAPPQFMDIISWVKTKPDDWCGEFEPDEE